MARRKWVPQANGCERGDPPMPALYSLGQHPARRAANAELSAGERIAAFLDDTYALISNRVSLPYLLPEVALAAQVAPINLPGQKVHCGGCPPLAGQGASDLRCFSQRAFPAQQVLSQNPPH